MAVSPSGKGTVSPATEYVTPGTSVTIKVLGYASGYHFTGWSGAYAGAGTGTSHSITFTMPNGAITETAGFAT
jgi:uncharacterized repeat protein (TIGR02543 family)